MMSVSVRDYISYLNRHKNEKGIISKGKFKNLFVVGDVGDDGNCLFYSIDYLTTHDAADLRKKVCNYYKKFDQTKHYPDGSLKSQINMHLLYDNDDGEGNLHSENICKNLKWASIMDVVALAEILQLNIVLFSYSAKDKGYFMQEYVYNNPEDTLFIKFNGHNHFQPLIPQFTINSPNKVSAESTPEKPDYLAEAQEVSPETMKMLGLLKDSPKTSKKKGSHNSSIKKFFGKGRGRTKTKRQYKK